MKNETKNAAKVAAKNNENLQFASSKKTATEKAAVEKSEKQKEKELLSGTCKYLERMQIGKENYNNLSQLFKRFPAAQSEKFIAATKNAKFSDFRAYMVAKYPNLGAAKSPARGWSPWYAQQFFEQYIKAAATNKNNLDYVAARNYLVAVRAELQTAK